MDLNQLILKHTAIRKMSSAYYHYRENRWRLMQSFVSYPAQLQLNKPIFLLGTQGGGLTFTSRIIRRHPDVISASGNSRYWAGQDESQNMYRDALPEELTWVDIQIEGQQSDDHNWLYANNAHLPYYLKTERDYTEALADRYRKFIYMVIAMNSKEKNLATKRFIDKSQSLSVRIGLVHKLLEDAQPKFLLLTRNPIVMCWRAASKDAVLSRLELPIEEKVDLAIQHWKNSMESVLAYEDTDVDLRIFRFEDILQQPQQKMQEVFQFLELDFDNGYMPGPDDVIPFGSMFDAFNKRKWYPVRSDINDRYLQEVPDWAAKSIKTGLSELLDKFGYRD